MTFRIDVSTNERDEDRFVRLATERGVVFIPMSEWADALAHAGLCSPSGKPFNSPPGGPPVAQKMAA